MWLFTYPRSWGDHVTFVRGQHKRAHSRLASQAEKEPSGYGSKLPSRFTTGKPPENALKPPTPLR